MAQMSKKTVNDFPVINPDDIPAEMSLDEVIAKLAGVLAYMRNPEPRAPPDRGQQAILELIYSIAKGIQTKENSEPSRAKTDKTK
jgi:hypothetical protein